MELPNSLYCSFIMPPPCEKGIFIEGTPWSFDKQEEICVVTETNVFSCACHSKDYCSSDYEQLMRIWQNSPGYSEDSKYTKCLDYVITAAKDGFTHPPHDQDQDDPHHLEQDHDEDYHVPGSACYLRYW
ncbi:hypothetical protein Aduo_016852 [Ancylostoma duodenale]